MSVANLCALCNNVLVANPVNQRHLSALSGSHVLAQCKRHAVLLARVMLLVTTCTGDVACQGEGRAHLLHYTFTHTFATRHVRTNVSLTPSAGQRTGMSRARRALLGVCLIVLPLPATSLTSDAPLTPGKVD